MPILLERGTLRKVIRMSNISLKTFIIRNKRVQQYVPQYEGERMFSNIKNVLFNENNNDKQIIRYALNNIRHYSTSCVSLPQPAHEVLRLHWTHEYQQKFKRNMKDELMSAKMCELMTKLLMIEEKSRTQILIDVMPYCQALDSIQIGG